jgi:hypothetical protein
MLIHRVSIYLALSSLLLAGGAAWSQPREVCCPAYDPHQELTVEGVVEKVETRYGQPASAGVYLLVETEDGSYQVHLGPRRWVKRQGASYSEGDQLTIVCAPAGGARAPAPGARIAVVARQITRGDRTIVLRDEDGWPRWRVRGRD